MELRRYQRRTIASGTQEVVCHHGDCGWWQVRICTCGLLHDLRPHPNPEVFYPAVYDELALQDEQIRRLQFPEEYR